MRKGRFFKYLLAMAMAVSTAGSAVAQKNLKLYFNEFTTGNQGVPELTMKGDVPNANENVSVSQSGFDWAYKYQVFLLNRQNCQDRVVANKVTVNGKEKSQASVSLTNFKYEVKQIQWNVMNDLFSDNLIGWTKTLQVSGISTPYTGSAKTGTTGSWAVFGKEMSFGKENLPGTNANLGFKGLRSFSIEEVNKWIIISRDTKLDDNCRVFVKAGQKGTAEPGANDWAFQVTYYEPELSFDGVSDLMYLDQVQNANYKISHPGAFNFTVTSYTSSNPDALSVDNNGKLTAKNIGDAVITLTMNDGVKQLTTSKHISVKTLTPQDGVQYYHDDSKDHTTINWSELNHTDHNDFRFEQEKTTKDGYTLLGKLISNSGKSYRVGSKTFAIPMSVPAYSTATLPMEFILDCSQTGVNASADYGGEIMFSETYQDLVFDTRSNINGKSLYKVWQTNWLGGNKGTDNNSKGIIDNKNSATSIEKDYYLTLMAACYKVSGDKTLTVQYWQKQKPSVITYYAYLTFDGNGGNITKGTTTQTIAKALNGSAVETANLNNITITAPTGYKFKGWNTKADGTGEHYDAQGAFRPSTTLTGGEGKGPVTLYAEWEPITYTVILVNTGYNTSSVAVSAAYGEPMPNVDKDGNELINPTKTYYKFDGYYYHEGNTSSGTPIKKYYNADLTSASNWDKTIDKINLYPHFVPCEYILTLDHAGGTNTIDNVKVTYDQTVPSQPGAIPTKSGYVFGGYYDANGVQYYDETMNSTVVWKNDKSDFVVTARWTPKKYYVVLSYAGSDGSTSSVGVYASYGEPMPDKSTANAVLEAPYKKGYTFDGFYFREGNNADGQFEKKYYNSDMTSANNWDRDIEVPSGQYIWLYPRFVANTTIITFDRNGAPEKYDWGGDNGTSNVVATYGQQMPQMIPPSREGYEFMGYFDAKTGGKQYYYTGVTWDKEVAEAILYAHWQAKTVKVIFNYTDPSKNLIAPAKEVSGYTAGTANHKSLSGTGVTAPSYEDYLFDGWYEQDGKNKTYDSEGNAVEGKYWVKNSNGDLVWQSSNDVNLYPQWIKDATTVEIAEIRLNNYEGDATHNYVGVSVSGMTSISNFRGKGYITVDGVNFLTWHKNGNQDNLLSAPLEEAPVWNIDAVDGSPNKVLIYTDTPEGRKYLGNKKEGGTTQQDAIGIENSQPDFYFTIYNERGWICLDDSEGHLFNHILYMKTGNVWEYENTGDNPQYNPIRILAYGSSTSYGDLMSTKVISEIKKKLSTPVVVNGVNTYPYAYNGKVDADLCKGILYVDMGGAASVIEANANELVNFKKEVSDNCLFFMPSNYTNTGLGNNVVSFNGTNYNSLTNLVIKDKVPFFNPYKFHVGNGVKASYHRDYDYKWNSMCLPFPVKLSSDMKYYKLYGSDNLRLAFQSVDANVIDANTPVACYGNGTFTLENTGIDVPADVDGEKVYVENVDAISCDDIKDYVENKKGNPAPQTWNFKGVRFDTYVYGTKNTGTLPNRAEKSLVYYFANDEFRYVNPEGRVKFAPFRAYLQAPEGSNAKTFSLLVFDEDGATDITDIIDGNAGVANGKIYDLLGRRVKTPLKGHIYIVDGKKKQY